MSRGHHGRAESVVRSQRRGLREVAALQRLLAQSGHTLIATLGDTETFADATLGEAVPGLNDVANLRIPYARLPTRAATAFSPEFAHWADMAGETIRSLLSRPKAGTATVGSVLAAARNTVATQKRAAGGERMGVAAAVQRLLKEFDHRDQVMLSARVWAQPPLSHGRVAHGLGVPKTWVVRHQPRAEAKLAELLADPVHRAVAEHADKLGRRLGPYLPSQVVHSELHRLGVDSESDAAQLLLHLAGPYARRGEWFENTATGGQQQAAAAVDAVFARSPAPSSTSLLHALTEVGMPRNAAAAYLRSRADWRRFGDAWVRWGESASSKAEGVLHALGAPATPDDIFAAIGPGPTRLSAVREALYRDHRFVRASLQTWGLREWGIDAYAGSIPQEIGSRIDAAGGTVRVDELIADMQRRLPDASVGSIKTNLNTLAFINDGATIRRRNESDAWPTIPALNSVQGAFRNGHKEIRWAVPVNPAVLRGSSQPIHAAVANALGVSPGRRHLFTSPHGPVSVIWRLWSTNGPSIGSVRALAVAANAKLKDRLVLIFNVEDGLIDAVRIDADAAGIALLSQLLGRTVRNPATALASSLDCPPGDVAEVLRVRGDDELTELIHD